jgi:hypothetical protein
MLGRFAPTDLPPEIAEAVPGAGLSDADRSFVVVLGRLICPRSPRVNAHMLQQLPANPDAAEFDDLPAAADEPTRPEVAERLPSYAWAMRARYPGISVLYTDAPCGLGFSKKSNWAKPWMIRTTAPDSASYDAPTLR